MKLFEYGNAYIEKSDWKDLALVKVCLCSMGIIIGVLMPKKARKYVIATALVTFAVTYIPLMHKFFKIVKESGNENG